MEQIFYRCAKCKGPVSKHHESFQVKREVRDERGRQIERFFTDKETGQKSSRVVEVAYNARGLGHWRCNRGCTKRTGTAERVVDPKGNKLPFAVARDIVVERHKATK